MKKTYFLLAFLIMIAPARGHDFVDARINSVSRAITKSPLDGNLYIKRGILFIEAKHYDKAKEDFKKARSHQEDLHAQFYLSQIAYLEHKYAKAEKDTLSLLSKKPDNKLKASLYRQLIAIYMNSKNIDKAINASKKFMQEMPSSIKNDDYSILINLLIKSKSNKKALDLLDQAVDKFGERSLFVNKRIELNVSLKHYNKALEDVENLIVFKHRLPYLYMEKGKILIESARPKEALKSFKKALSLVDKLSQTKQKIPAVSELKIKLGRYISNLRLKK